MRTSAFAWLKGRIFIMQTKRQQVAVGGVISNAEGKVLFVKRAKTDKFMPDVWEVPGGGIEYAESPTVGLARELKEECDIEVTVLPEPLAIGEYFIETDKEKIHRVELTFKCVLKREAEITLSEEHDAYLWVDPQDFQQLKMTDYMEKIVKSSLLQTKRLDH